MLQRYGVERVSVENIDPTRSTEVLGMVVVGMITAMFIYCFVAMKISESKRKDIIKKLEPFIDEITKEIHEIYVKYTKAMKIFNNSGMIKKMQELFGNVFTIKENNSTILNETEFAKELLNNIAKDIKILLKKGKPQNIYCFELLYGHFDDNKIYSNSDDPDDAYEQFEKEYLSKYYDMCKKITKSIEEQTEGTISLYSDMNGDLMLFLSLRVEYKLSQELLEKLLKASKGK
jgi:hypothetical protein